MAPDLLTARLARALLPALLLALPAFSALGGVVVTQNEGTGATSWPGTPLVATVSNPAAQLTVGESFGGATSYTQTFTIPATSNYTLQTIYLYVGGGTGTTPTSTVTLNLFDLGGRVAPFPNSYAPGTNLLGGSGGLPISYTSQPNGLLRLDFTGSDQVMLLAGRMYAFELAGVGGTTPMNWIRTISDTYAGGAAYRNRSWINGTNARDFGMAVYGVINTDPVPPTESTVNASILHQRIDGFGAGVVFLDAGLNPLSEGQMDQLYGTGPGQFGLTLIRVRISPFGNFGDALTNGQRAHARGARILASPWSPPASMKTNNDFIGGSLRPSEYGNFVAYLNNFAATMAAAGAPVSVISLQNEPDIQVTYESCDWTPEELRIFCRDFAGGINAAVMMPESFRFNHAISDPTLNDPAAAANVDYIGGHLYGGAIQNYPLAHSLGKPTWMTEYLINDQTITTAIETGQQISDCLTVGNMSAYIWWKNIGNANGLLNAAGAPQRRGYVMAQFSRFVRPGDFRIDVAANNSPLAISAFKDPVSGRFAIVAVNATTVSETHQFNLNGITTASVTPWITSDTQFLQQLSVVPIADDAFGYVLPPLSIITFAGTNPPEITSAARASGTAGTPFSFAITATNSPTDYAADGLPPGLEIDPETGMISGTPTAAGEYVATVMVANDGGSDTYELTITVLKANASITLGGLAQLYDGTPRNVTVNTTPSSLDVLLTYNGESTAPVYPGVYTVVATIDDDNYVGSTTATLEVGITALVRHMTSLNGGIDGSVQVLAAKDSTLNSGAWVSGDLLVPGTPQARVNGTVSFAGTINGPGSVSPSSHTLTLNRGSVLRHLVRRIDPLALPVVAAPPAPTGTRNVTLNQPGQSAGDFATVLNLTLDSKVGLIAVPPGTYGNFTANSGSGFALGVAGTIEPAAYNLQNLTLNSGARLEIVGPVVLTLNGSLSVNSGVAFSNHAAEWLALRLASGHLTLNGAVELPAHVVAPSGTVTLNGKSALRGTIKADRLIVNSDALLETP
jgi:O-glycosyl hydrolase